MVVPRRRSVSCIAAGSCATTLAPAASSSSMSVSAGDSRMSSVFALKASPHTAMRVPFTSPPSADRSFWKSRRFCSSLASSTARSTAIGAPRSLEVFMSAFTSFGKHEPP